MSWISILASAALKGTIILAAAWLAALILRKQSAAARHLLWTGAAAAALVLPFLSISLPAWRVPASSVLAPLDLSVVFHITATAKTDAAATSISHLPAAPAAASPTSAPWRPNLPLSLLFVWAAGAAIGIVQVLAACVVMWRLRRRARPFPDPALCRDLAQSLGIRHEVQVFEIARGRMPIAYGLLRPAVFLPSDAGEWSGECLRMVLLHEFAHVRRGDLATHLMARAALTLYWWNPLAWSAWREFLKERERAADDLVLAAGARASTYAEHLLDVARSMRPEPATACAAIAMARPSQLEGRLLAILDGATNRQAARPAAALAVVLGAVLLAAPLAAVRAQEAATPSEDQTKKLDAEIRRAIAQIQMDVVFRGIAVPGTLLAVQSADSSAQEIASDVDATIQSATAQRNYQMLDQAASAFEKQQRYVYAYNLLTAALSVRGQVFGDRSPEYAAGLMRLGDLSAKRRNEADAKDFYSRAVAISSTPETAAAFVYLGTVAMRSRDYLAARDHFERARQADPGGPQARAATMWLAMVAQGQGDSLAGTLYRQALNMGTQDTPEAALIMELYESWLRDQGRTGEADSLKQLAAGIRKTHIRELEAAVQSRVSTPSVGPPFKVGGGVSAPSLLFKKEPEYSEEARAAKYQGTVALKVTVGPDGMAHDIEVIRSLGLGLDEKAAEAVSVWKFRPGTKDGVPVPVLATIEVNFRLM
jgi:TonB family protein